MHSFVRRKFLGISLLEVMLSLSIIAVIIIMATRYYGVAQTGSQIDQVRHQVGNLISALSTYKASSGTSTVPTITDLVDDGLLPSSSSYISCTSGDNPTCTMTSPFGGTITVATSDLDSVCRGGTATTGATCFTITVPGFNSNAQCNLIAAGFNYATCTTTSLTVPVN